jgi:hypothetical protein
LTWTTQLVTAHLLCRMAPMAADEWYLQQQSSLLANFKCTQGLNEPECSLNRNGTRQCRVDFFLHF